MISVLAIPWACGSVWAYSLIFNFYSIFDSTMAICLND
jgi:hypothetical protein